MPGGQKDGISTTTIGFGEDYDEELLRGMADAGGGNTYYIERPDQAPAIFNDELQGLLDIAAQNVRVEVRPADAVTLAAVHHEYPRTTQQDGALRLELGDLYPREPKSLLCEFLVSDVAAAAVAVVTLVVTADVVNEQGIEHQRIELPVTVSLAEGPKVDAEVRRELLLLEAAKVRRQALEDQRAGEYERGRVRLANMQALIVASPFADDVMREEAADLSASEAQYAAGMVSEADRKYMYQRSYNRSSGRAAKDALIRRTKQQNPDA